MGVCQKFHELATRFVAASVYRRYGDLHVYAEKLFIIISLPTYKYKLYLYYFIGDVSSWRNGSGHQMGRRPVCDAWCGIDSKIVYLI